MQLRTIILSALGTIVAVAFFKLVFDSQGDVDPDVDEGEIEKALAEYERSEKRTNRAEDVVVPRAPVRKSRSKSASSDEESASRPSDSNTFTKPPPLPEDETEDEPEGEITFKTKMDDANKEYDRANYEGAREAALELLEEQPKNVRMNRIVVSSSCIMGDEDIASKHYELLPPRDQRQMARRCKRYGIEFDDVDQ